MNLPPRPTVRLVAVLVAMITMTGCSGLQVRAGSDSSPSGASSAPYVAPQITATSPAPWQSPLTFSVTKGTLTKVAVTNTKSKEALDGWLGASSTQWSSTTTPDSGATYAVSADVLDAGQSTHLTTTMKVATMPSSAKMHFGILPGTGATVGVNAPVVIRFDHNVGRKADVESALVVSSSTPVAGAWHWISKTEVHFRPESPWPAHTKIRVTANFDGLQMSDTRWATRSLTVDFATGDAHQTIVDDKTKTFTVKVNGVVKYVWPTSLGRPEFETRTGNYIVLEKHTVREMTSCSAGITCDKASPDYYDLQVQWATRLSWSGTFIHAAPWSVAKQGLVDSSHGCIHLTIDRAKLYQDQALYGDLVTVLHTSRPIDDLIRSGDPGTADWNTPWPAWVQGSALGQPVTTVALTA